MTRHPEADHLEAYAMGQLPEPKVLAIEEHLLTCEACRSEVTKLDQDIQAIRRALKNPYL